MFDSPEQVWLCKCTCVHVRVPSHLCHEIRLIIKAVQGVNHTWPLSHPFPSFTGNSLGRWSQVRGCRVSRQTDELESCRTVRGCVPISWLADWISTLALQEAWLPVSPLQVTQLYNGNWLALFFFSFCFRFGESVCLLSRDLKSIYNDYFWINQVLVYVL